MSKAKKSQPKNTHPPQTRAREVIVTVDDRRLGEMADVARGLEKAGLQVSQVLKFTGQVVGHWSADSLQPLQQVDGMTSAAESREIVLPPPESDIQ